MIHLNQPALKTIEHLIQQIPGGISFAQGALRVGGVDKSIREYVQTVLSTDKADYYCHSLGIAVLRQKLADTLSAKFNTTVAFENVAVTHGSINGIAALCLLLLDHGDEVLLPEPTYPSFVNAISVAKAKVTFVRAYEHVHAADGSSEWVFDLEKLKAARTARTKMVIIAHPSNPCGVCLTPEEMNGLAQWCEEENIYCIFDEAYENYFFDTPTTSSTPLIAPSKFVIRTGSFSKTYGMSGWRVGYVVAPRDIITHMAAVQDGVIVCPSVVGQYAASYALDHPEIADNYTQYIRNNRDMAHNMLKPLIDTGVIRCAKPEAGFFLFLQTTEQDAGPIVQNLITHAQVALVPGADFGPSSKNCMRLCYARDTELLKQGLTRCVDYLQKTYSKAESIGRSSEIQH